MQSLESPPSNDALNHPSESTQSEKIGLEYLGQQYRFQFHGQAMEYFGIWIVNIVLTIITLSLYSPWAKVRRLRYFYGNTEFFNRQFDFTGIPTKILFGRLIAIGIYIAISVSAQYSPTATLIGIAVLYLAMPWLIRATLRFTAKNSKYANSRFYFSGSSKAAYLLFVKCIFIYVFTLGIFTPYLIYLYQRFCINNLYAGQLNFQLHAKWTEYMKAVYFPILIFLVVLGVVGGFTFGKIGLASTVGIYTLVAVYVFGLLFIGPLIAARIFMTTWNNVSIGNSVFKTDCNQWRYTWIVATNWIAKALTLGLMSAWASVRLYKYRIESLSLTLNDDPDDMMNLAQHDVSAIAEEISDIFDIDISL